MCTAWLSGVHDSTNSKTLRVPADIFGKVAWNVELLSRNGFVLETRYEVKGGSEVLFTGLTPGEKYFYRISSPDGEVSFAEASFETKSKFITISTIMH